MKAKFILAIAIVFCIAGLVAFDVYRNSPMIQNPELFKKKIKKLDAKRTHLSMKKQSLMKESILGGLIHLIL